MPNICSALFSCLQVCTPSNLNSQRFSTVHTCKQSINMLRPKKIVTGVRVSLHLCKNYEVNKHRCFPITRSSFYPGTFFGRISILGAHGGMVEVQHQTRWALRRDFFLERGRWWIWKKTCWPCCWAVTAFFSLVDAIGWVGDQNQLFILWEYPGWWCNFTILKNDGVKVNGFRMTSLFLWNGKYVWNHQAVDD